MGPGNANKSTLIGGGGGCLLSTTNTNDDAAYTFSRGGSSGVAQCDSHRVKLKLIQRHAEFFRRVYAPLNIVCRNVPSPRWQPMMLSHLRCGTKVDHLKLLKMIWHV